MLAQAALILSVDTDIDCNSMEASRNTRLSDTRSSCPPRFNVASSDSMEIERLGPKEQNFPAEIGNIMLQSRRPTTHGLHLKNEQTIES